MYKNSLRPPAPGAIQRQPHNLWDSKQNENVETSEQKAGRNVINGIKYKIFPLSSSVSLWTRDNGFWLVFCYLIPS